MALVGIGMMPMPNRYYASFAGGGMNRIGSQKA
jgi:hypothetical protein